MRAFFLVATAFLAACGTTEQAPEGCGTAVCPAAYEAFFATTTAGSYVITVTFDGYPSAELTCVLAAGQSGHCETNDDQVPASASFGATGITVDVVNSAQSIALTVTRDGTQLFTSTQKPTYAPAYPNGESCDPVCPEAEDMLELP
jgi:hypothetical protein